MPLQSPVSSIVDRFQSPYTKGHARRRLFLGPEPSVDQSKTPDNPLHTPPSKGEVANISNDSSTDTAESSNMSTESTSPVESTSSRK